MIVSRIISHSLVAGRIAKKPQNIWVMLGIKLLMLTIQMVHGTVRVLEDAFDQIMDVFISMKEQEEMPLAMITYFVSGKVKVNISEILMSN